MIESGPSSRAADRLPLASKDLRTSREGRLDTGRRCGEQFCKVQCGAVL